MSVQIIKNNSQPEYAVVPIADYEDLLKKAEMLDDVVAYDRAKAELANGEDELVRPNWLMPSLTARIR